MLQSLDSLLTPALMARVTLVLNHVLSSEAVATDRLRPHAGRALRIELQEWPALLPPPPRLAFLITPAGLLEWRGESGDDHVDLKLGVQASNPGLLLAKLAVGERPAVSIDGDAGLATDVDWLVQNLRWDVAADLEGLVGPIAAEQMQRLGIAFASGLRAALQRLDTLRPGR